MKKILCAFLSVVFIFVFSAQALACTSFAVYSQQKLYGMNLDNNPFDLKFVINQIGARKVFQMEMKFPDYWIAAVGMNDRGLFTSIQSITPETSKVTDLTSNQMEMGNLARFAINNFDTVDDVRKFLKNTKIVWQYDSIHDIFADKSGDTMVVEVGANENTIINGNNKFTVMTNFTNRETIGKNYREVYGIGSQRYVDAYGNIENNFDAFNVDRAFETLDIAKQNCTLSSLVFDPDKNEVYISLNRDYSRIWKVSIKDGTLETFKGFREPSKMSIGKSGVLGAYLLQMASRDIENKASGNNDIPIVSEEKVNSITENPTTNEETINEENASSNTGKPIISERPTSSNTNQPIINEEAVSTDNSLMVFNEQENTQANWFDFRILYIVVPIVIIAAIALFFVYKRYRKNKSDPQVDT